MSPTNRPPVRVDPNRVNAVEAQVRHNAEERTVNRLIAYWRLSKFKFKKAVATDTTAFLKKVFHHTDTQYRKQIRFAASEHRRLHPNPYSTSSEAVSVRLPRYPIPLGDTVRARRADFSFDSFDS
jgi:hypothetical protein